MNGSSFLRFVAFFGARTRLRSCRTAICPSVKMANLRRRVFKPRRERAARNKDLPRLRELRQREGQKRVQAAFGKQLL